MDRVEYFDGGLAPVGLVEHFVHFPISPLPDGLNDLPGVGGVGIVFEDDGLS